MGRDWCAECKYEYIDGREDPCVSCEAAYDNEPTNFERKKPITHAENIRVMTDEELAEWLVHKIEGNGFDGYQERVDAWLDWLRQEVKDET